MLEPQLGSLTCREGDYLVVPRAIIHRPCPDAGEACHHVVLDHHPLDTIGWGGYYYPWAFNIHDFEPIVGSLRQPPPVHRTFEGDGFVVCSFAPPHVTRVALACEDVNYGACRLEDEWA